MLVCAGLDVPWWGRCAPQRGSSNNEDTHPHAKMGVEEQKEEREILDSIYPEEITGRYSQIYIILLRVNVAIADISETEFRIAIQLEVTNEDEDDSEARTFPWYLAVS